MTNASPFEVVEHSALNRDIQRHYCTDNRQLVNSTVTEPSRVMSSIFISCKVDFLEI